MAIVAADETGPRAQAAHLLGRIGFGPRPGDIDEALRRGFARVIEDQLYPAELADDEAEAELARLSTIGASPAELLARFPEGRGARLVLDEMATARLVRAVLSTRQLEEVLVDFWFNHFNVYGPENFTRYALPSYEREAIRPYVLGRFRDLLGATARHPAMLFYLDNWLSSVPRNGRGGINENYARELMELHTLGVDAGYTQEDVIQVARAFTGWTIDDPRRSGRFVFDPRRHDPGEKIVLGTRIPSGGIDEGERVLDLLAAHPATARRVAWRLCQRLLADEPPPSAVDRAAATFTATGGDLRRVVASILLDGPELFDPSSFGAKAKTPLELVASALRAVGARPANWRPVTGAVALMGMPLYAAVPPTGYSNDGRDWMNASSLLTRMSFALELAGGGLRGVAARAPVGGDAASAASWAAAEIFGNRLSEATWAAATRPPRGPLPAAARALGVLLASPEFQAR